MPWCRGKGPFGAAAVFLLLLLLPSGCGRQEPVRIGYVGGLSGRVADLGRDGRNGVMLAVAERNARGGVRGSDVELLIRDDGQDLETALKVDGELVDLGVAAIVGHMTSSMSLGAVPLMNDRAVPLVSPTSTTTLLSGMDDQFLRVSATTKEYAAQMARYIREETGVETVTVVYDLGNLAYTESWYTEFRREFVSRGGLVAGVITFSAGPEAHFEELAREALSSVPDALVLVASALDTAMIAQQVRKIGSDTLIVTSAWASTEELIELGGAAVEGMILSQFFDRESSAPLYVAFAEHYRNQFGSTPGFAAVKAYDAATVVLDALEDQRRGESLKDAIIRIGTFRGLQGPVTFNAFGDVEGRTIMTTVRDGTFRVLE